jgi:tetratricopeptide (TPR) repeat protein
MIKTMRTIHSNTANTAESRFLIGLTPYMCILLFIGAIYAHTVFFGFTYFDDAGLILDNSHFLADMSNFFKAFHRDVLGATNEFYYRPLLTISLMIDAWFGGISPFIYHLTNILIHMGSSCLVLVLLRRLGYAQFPSFLCAVFFAVHPALCQAVAWIPGRNDSLLALFTLPAFIFFIDYMAQRKTIYLALHLLFFSLALLTKENALALLILCPFYVLLITSKRVFESRNLPVFIGWLAVTCGWFMLRKTAFLHPIQYTLEYMFRSLLTNLPAVMLYIGKFLLPFNLSVLPVLRDSTLIYGYVAAGLIFIALYFSKHTSRPRVVFGLLWFLAFLLPAFIRPSPNPPADFMEHRMYVPALGVIMLLLETNALRGIVFGKNLITFFTGLMLVLFSVINVSYSANFKDSHNFWEDAATHSPTHYVAQCNFGVELAKKGDFPQAIKHLKEALRLNSGYTDAQYNLDAVLRGNPKFEKEVKQHLEALKTNPTSYIAHNDLGLALGKQGKFMQAIWHYQEALRLKPDYAEAYNNWGLALVALGRKEEAILHYRKALKINPHLAEIHNNWGLVLSDQGKTEEAIAHYREALRLKPNLANAHNNWGMTLAYANRLDEAIQHFQDALKIAPNYSTAQENLNAALKANQKN